jgi:hypothetical protein
MFEDQCTLYCVNTEKDSLADILSRSDKRMKVVINGTSITIVLMRKDIRRPYVGYEAGLEFETFGEVD